MSIENTPPLRDNQEQSIKLTLKAFDEGVDSVVIQAPTGTGKTLISRFLAEPYGSTLVGVPTKQLQDQYAKELIPTGGVKVLKGKSNYYCTIEGRGVLPVSEASCQFETSRKQIRTCMENKNCPYIEAKLEAQASKIAVLSFAGQLSWAQFAPIFFGIRDLHIIDEAHKMEDIVRDHFSIVQTESEIRRQMGKHAKLLPKMPEKGGQEEILSYLRDCSAVCVEKLADMQKIYECETLEELFIKAEDSLLLSLNLNPILKFKGNIDELFRGLNEDTDSYVAYLEMREGKKTKKWEPSLVTKPVHLQSLVERFVRGNKTVFMSATIIGVESWAKSMGLENYKFIDVPSTFPAKNRRVFFTPIGNLNSTNISKLVPQGCELLRKIRRHPELSKQKGLVHTPSYALTEIIEQEMKDDPNLIFGRKGDPSALQKHLQSTEPTLLIGPAYKEGIDLKDDLCRVQIVWKAAYKNPNDPLVLKKGKTDPLWETRQMVADFIQQIGRGVRSKEDWAVTYVFDGNLQRLLLKFRALVPSYIWESFQNI